MSRSQREGPFGPPTIHRERASYDTPYWSQAPPPARYPQPAPPSHVSHPPPPQHGRSPHRVPPPPDYHHHAPPPQHPSQYHQSHHHQYPGRQWRDPGEHHYPPPPSYHHSVNRRDIPRDEYSRPYNPMQVEYEPTHPPHRPPPQQAPRTPPTPPTPPIQFRQNSGPELVNSAMKKMNPSSKDSKKKKGDALSLLAKVSTAMADPEEEKKKAATDITTSESVAGIEAAQLTSPPRGAEKSPIVWTTPKQQYSDHNSRQITPTSVDHHAPPRTGPPLPRGYYQQSYPRYATPSSYAGAPSSGPYYRGGDSPTAIISERGSFEQDDRAAPYGTPPRRYVDEHSHYAPYTYVQQPRMEDKTILRKKFSWKHYPELERFLIANRDEYLRHSALNYTAEQKQYNNWLTERLLEVAARHHYVFDPEDFNFVAVRDRIRCYYKSYVQTARKRGLPLINQKVQNKQMKTTPQAEVE